MSEPAPKLSLSIAHQPTKIHRFRYLKEVSDGRMGSVLRSRAPGGKTPVAVTATVQSVSPGCKLKLVGCTVFEDLMTHPFYLTGDDCRNGVFEKELSSKSEQEVRLEKVGIVCTPKKQRKSKGKPSGASENGVPAHIGLQNGTAQEDNFYMERIQKYNFFGKPPREKPFEGKDINKLRLAFQVFYQLPGSSENDWLAADCSPVSTEVIGDAKIFSKMEIELIIPDSVSRPDQDVWLYTKDDLPAQNVAELTVRLEHESEPLIIELQPKELKKHLVVFNFEQLTLTNVFGSFSVTLVDKKNDDSSEPVKLELINDPSGSGPANKKTRRDEKPTVSQDPMDELLGTFLDGNGDLQELPELYVEHRA